MKIRNGFVSNSSTSSFVIAFIGNKTELKKKIEEVFDKLPENYPIKFPKMSPTIMNGIDKEVKSKKQYAQYLGYDNFSEAEDEMWEEYVEYLNKGWTLYFGGFSDDGGEEFDAFLCNSDINYKDDEMYFHQDGGY